MQKTESKKPRNFDKYAIIITICFFLVVSFVTFYHHDYWIDGDYLLYSNLGHDILDGNGKNVKMLNAGPGGPVFYAFLDSLTGDAFLNAKLISLLGGTGIVALSYLVIKNIFGSKVALVGQLFVVFSPRIGIISLQTLNEIIPIFLIFGSFFFITKKQLKPSPIIIAGILLGTAFMFRYQSAFILVAFVVFLLIRNKKIRTNLVYAALLVLLFTAAASPALLYNYFTYGVILDSDPNFELMVKSKYKPPNEIIEEFKQKIANDEVTDTYGDPNLFLKNYFYNLFNHNPNKLFNFDTISNLSPIPTIPFLGLILVFGSLFYLLKIQFDRKNLMVSAGIFFGTLFLVLLFGDINIHFFALIILPIIGLTILNFNKIENNLLPVLVAPAVYLVLISIIPVSKPEHLLPIWIMIPALSSVFFIQVIPGMISKITNTYKSPIKEL